MEESNILIAEFMGYEIREHTPENNSPFLVRYKDGVWAGEWATNGADKYHTSWDWLMPVVDKIEHLFETKTTLSRFEMHSHYARFWLKDGVQWIAGCYVESPDKPAFDTKIQAVYYVCVEFIKWYNLQRIGAV